MKFLFVTLLLSISPLFAQVEIIHYTDKKIHARAAFCYSDHLVLGCNNGEVYAYNLKNAKSTVMNPVDSFPEIRDMGLCNSSFFVMQTGGKSAIYEGGSIMQYDKRGGDVIDSNLFLDGFAFEGAYGFAMADPVKGKFQLFYSADYGKSWEVCETLPDALEGEAAFAASGTTVHILNKEFIFVTGGKKSRIFTSKDFGKTWTVKNIPFAVGASSGAYSMGFESRKKMVVVGGDYTQANNGNGTCFYTKNGGKKWKASKKSPTGYRSCVIYTAGVYYCCGTNGIDYSKDGGKTWSHLADNNCFALAFDNQFIYASSINGTFLKFPRVE